MTYDASPVKRWYESTDQETKQGALSDQIVFDVSPGYPGGGVYRGEEAIFGEFLPELGKAWKRADVEIDDVIEAGDTLVVLGRYEGEAEPTGADFSVKFVHVWDVEGDQIKSLRAVADTAVLADAMAGRTD